MHDGIICIIPKKPDALNVQYQRIVTDFRKLNNKTISNRFPIPNWCKHKTQPAGFYQIQMPKDSIEKTALTYKLWSL